MIGVNFYALGWKIAILDKISLKFYKKLVNKGFKALI
jgi:hypothetical protein